MAGKASQQSTWGKLTLLVRHWSAMESFITQHPDGPWWLSVNQSGVEPLKYYGA